MCKVGLNYFRIVIMYIASCYSLTESWSSVSDANCCVLLKVIRFSQAERRLSVFDLFPRTFPPGVLIRPRTSRPTYQPRHNQTCSLGLHNNDPAESFLKIFHCNCQHASCRMVLDQAQTQTKSELWTDTCLLSHGR